MYCHFFLRSKLFFPHNAKLKNICFLFHFLALCQGFCAKSAKGFAEGSFTKAFATAKGLRSFFPRVFSVRKKGFLMKLFSKVSRHAIACFCLPFKTLPLKPTLCNQRNKCRCRNSRAVSKNSPIRKCNLIGIYIHCTCNRCSVRNI